MARPCAGKTPAIRRLDELGERYVEHAYAYRERGGAAHAAEALGLPPEAVVKTLVLRTDDGRRLLLLMHGDRQVSFRKLARAVEARRVHSCTPDEAFKVTGYLVGGISPFAPRTPLPVYAESTIFDLPRVWINAGRRGLLLEIESALLERVLAPRRVACAE